MKKKTSKENGSITEFLYALVLQFIFIPVMGFFSYNLYDKIAVLGSLSDSFVLFFIIIFILVLANISCIYGLAYLLNRVYKYDVRYYRYVGIFSSIIMVVLKIYYTFLEDMECVIDTSLRCLVSSSRNKSVTIVMIFVITYYFVYLITDYIVKKSIEYKDKEQD